MRSIVGHGISSIFVMPEHLPRCHPFVGLSFLDICREDESDTDDSSNESESGSAQSNYAEPRQSRDPSPDNEDTTPTEPQSGAQVANVRQSAPSEEHTFDGRLSRSECQSHNNELDRPPSFVIDDNPNAGPSVFFAKKKIESNAMRSEVTAVAVRERGDEKHSKLLRFLCCLPAPISRTVDTWIAVPHELSHLSFLFSKRNDDGTLVPPRHDSLDVKEMIESFIWKNCTVLTIGQRCADWFVLRQFRITGTNAATLLSKNETVRNHVGFQSQPSSNDDEPIKKTFKKLVDGWFNFRRSTEEMKRGQANESPALTAVSKKDFVVNVFECGMLGIKGVDFLACSPDGVALIDINGTPFQDSSDLGSNSMKAIACVEIKTSVASSSVAEAVSLATAEDIFCELGDQNCRTYVDDRHVFQILQQMITLNVQYCIYVVCGETGILRTVVVHCSSETLAQCRAILRSLAEPLVSWAQQETMTIPPYADAGSKKVLKGHFPFWKSVNHHVREHGPFPPLKLFKHGIQSFYSKTKGGVDGSTQARAVFRSSTSSFRWEQKLVTQTIKTLWVNAFISWRMQERKQVLENKDSFGGLEQYRQRLNAVQSLADFSMDCSQELLRHADLMQIERTDRNEEERRVSDANIPELQLNRIHLLAKQRKRNRLAFFNGNDGKDLRLSSIRHEYKEQRPAMHCALCGNNTEGNEYRGHRSIYKCQLCCVHLCLRVWPGYRKSCWSVWHSARSLQRRSTQSSRPVQPACSAEIGNERIGSERREHEEGAPPATRRRRA